jgi:hypothetical protein
MFAHKFDCPLITVGECDFPEAAQDAKHIHSFLLLLLLDINGHSCNMDEVMGILTQHSFVPHPASKYGKEMSFIQRSYNTLLYLYESAVRRFSYMPAQNKLAKRYFRDAFEGDIPDLSVVQKRISAMLANTHRLTNTRPKMAAQVDIAGAHLKEPEEPLSRYLKVSVLIECE